LRGSSANNLTFDVKTFSIQPGSPATTIPPSPMTDDRRLEAFSDACDGAFSKT
jgi:hypothetical protein